MGANNGPNKPKGNNPPRRNNNNRNNRNNKRSPLEQSARRNVNIANQPGINSAYRGIDQSNLDFQNQDLGVQSIYGDDLTKQLGNTSDRFNKATSDIVSDLQAQQTNLMGALNQAGLPTSELAANTAVFGAQGNTPLNSIANDRNRMAGYGASAEREAGLSERYARQNLSQGLSDTQQQYYNRIADIQDQKGPQILAELDRLRQQQQNNKQDRLYSELLQDQIGNMLGGNRPNRGPNGPGGGGGGGNIGPGGGTVSHAAIDNQGGLTSEELASQPSSEARRIKRTVQDINYGGPNDTEFAGFFRSLPKWLRDIYLQNQGPDRWDALNNPYQRQVFRRTRPTAKRLYNTYQRAGGVGGAGDYGGGAHE